MLAVALHSRGSIHHSSSVTECRSMQTITSFSLQLNIWIMKIENFGHVAALSAGASASARGTRRWWRVGGR